MNLCFLISRGITNCIKIWKEKKCIDAFPNFVSDTLTSIVHKSMNNLILITRDVQIYWKANENSYKF